MFIARILWWLLRVGVFVFSSGLTYSDASDVLRHKRAVGSKPPNVVGDCGGNLTGQMGNIASPNFPRSSYPPSSSCNWTVTVDPGLVVNISFVYMDMENGPVQRGGNCGADSITIYDVSNPGVLVGSQRFCGYETVFNPVLSATNQILVDFVSDHSEERSGFVLGWDAVPRPEIMFSCDFEMSKGLCGGWSQSDVDSFDWSFGNGETPSHRTGPRYDRTLSSRGRYREGIYAYIEATGKRAGQEAVLVTPTFDLSTSTSHCLTFWYNMRGSGMGSLLVERVHLGQPRSSARNIFKIQGDQGELWREARVNVNGGGESIQFLFIGIRGRTFRSDMAIDDITILPTRCDN